MVALTILVVYSFLFNLTEDNTKFKFYLDTFDEFSFEELKGELKEIVNSPKISHKHLQDEILGPRKNSANKN